MKKRNFLILSSIVCSLVTIALVTTTLFGIFKKNDATAPENAPTVDVNVGGNEIISEIKDLYLIVGDEYSDGVLSTANYSGSLLAPKDESTFIALTIGTESISIKNGDKVIAYNINVFEKGDGSEANPYNIVRPEDLLLLTSENEGEYTYYVQRCNLDLSGYESWAPIGKLTTPFIGSYDGNGYKIVNMNIVVTPENVDNYIDNALTVGGSNGTMLTVGFFGFVGDVYAINTSIIKGVNIENANINTTAIETEEVRPTLTITQSYVAPLAGYVAYTEVIGLNGEANSVISSNINSAITVDNVSSVNTGITGFIGGAYFSNISGYKVVSNIDSKNPGNIVENADKNNYYGANYAGLIGLNHNSNVSNCAVELSVSVRNYENTIISGAIGYIKTNNNQPTEILIENIEVNNLVVRLNRYSYLNNYANIIAGAINCNYNELATINNISVNNAIINSIGSGQVSGLINTNYGTIKDAIVSGLFKGTIVAGLVYENYGTIEYTSELETLDVVDVDLRAQTKAAGMAIYNYGTIKGASGLTQIKASITWSPVVADFDKIKDSSMLAGIAVYSGEDSVIENIYTLTNLYDGVNMAGAVGTLSGTIKNLNINTTMRTIAGEVGTTVYAGQTTLVGGIVAIVPADGEGSVVIEDVVANITINNTEKINTEYKFGFDVFGSIIAKVEKDVEIINNDELNKVEVTLFSNYSSEVTQIIGAIAGQVADGVEVSYEGQKVTLCVIESAPNASIVE